MEPPQSLLAATVQRVRDVQQSFHHLQLLLHWQVQAVQCFPQTALLAAQLAQRREWNDDSMLLMVLHL